MPKAPRHKTNYKGVTYHVRQDGARTFYIRYRRLGSSKVIEEKTTAGTAAQAAQVRLRRMDGGASNAENREKQKWTISKLWADYLAEKGSYPSEYTETKLVELYVLPIVGARRPDEITGKDIDKIRKVAGAERVRKISGKKKKGRPASDRARTVDYALRLLKRIAKHGGDTGKTSGLTVKIKLKDGRKRTGYLTPAQFVDLFSAAASDDNKISGGVVILAAITGLRKGEIFNLQWSDIDFERGYIELRGTKGAKLAGDEVEYLPLSQAAKDFLSSLPRYESSYVFPGQNGGRRSNITRAWERIKEKAKLPDNFRFHDLRHAYATAMAESKDIDLRELQKLLRHRSINMTMRYAHIIDERLKKAADVATGLFDGALERAAKAEPETGAAIIPIDHSHRR